MPYYFEKHQPLKFEIMDGNNKNGGFKMIGSSETTLG